MWTAVRNETQGRVDVQVFPENNKTPGSDPAVLKMLTSGDDQGRHASGSNGRTQSS